MSCSGYLKVSRQLEGYPSPQIETSCKNSSWEPSPYWAAGTARSSSPCPGHCSKWQGPRVKSKPLSSIFDPVFISVHLPWIKEDHFQFAQMLRSQRTPTVCTELSSLGLSLILTTLLLHWAGEKEDYNSRKSEGLFSYLPAEHPWVNHLTSLGNHFLILKIEIK
jgi:hypothetical protein